MKLGLAMAVTGLVGFVALAGPAVALELLLESRLLPARETCEKNLHFLDSEDYREVLNAFLEKRSPQFKGR